MIYTNNKNNFSQAFDCLTTPLCDCLNWIFFCCGKKYRCDICNCRFRLSNELSRHIRDVHSEIFSFKDEFTVKTKKPTHIFERQNYMNDQSVYLRVKSTGNGSDCDSIV